MYDLNEERSYPTPFADSPLLPLLLMALAVQKHSPDTTIRFENEYDYIVVGAGSAGSVMASRLSEIPCVSVLLLEAGKRPPLLTELPIAAPSFADTDVDWQYRTVPQKHAAGAFENRQLKYIRGKMLGGSGNINYMNYIRGNMKIYDIWAEGGAEGWSYKEVLYYFKKLEDETDWRFFNGFHNAGGPITATTQDYQSPMENSLFLALQQLGYHRILDPNGPKQTGGFIPQQNVRSGQRCSSAKAYLVPSENRKNLDIVANAFVTQIVIDNGRAIGVQFDFEGRRYFVKSRTEIIVSAGTISTPHLLMLSGIGPANTLRKFGLPVHSDLPVGENLHDHCQLPMIFELNDGLQRITQRITSEETIRSYIQTKSGILTTFGGLGMESFTSPETYNDFPTLQMYLAEIDSKALKSMGITSKVYNQVYKPYENRSLYSCDVNVLNPRSRGYITLQSADPYDYPIIDPKYLENTLDFEKLVEGMKFCNRLGNSVPMRRIGSAPIKTLFPQCEFLSGNEDLYLRCVGRLLGGVGNHQVGTAKMGRADDPSVVVDPQLRVKGISGLRVVDASVMPLVPNGNTNVPTMMVAEKAADMVKDDLICHGPYPQQWK